MKEEGAAAGSVMLPVFYQVKLCSEVSQLPMHTTITISPPNAGPHPLELEVERAKDEIARKQSERNGCVGYSTDESIIQPMYNDLCPAADDQPSSPLMRNDELLPLSVVNYGAGVDAVPSLNCGSKSPEECTAAGGDSSTASLQYESSAVVAASPTHTVDWDSKFPPTQDYEPDPFAVDKDTMPIKSDDLSCHLCNKRFAHRKNVYAHLRGVHSCEPSPISGLVCPLCRMTFLRHIHLRHHFQTLHQIIIPQLELTFPSPTEFEAWKAQTEKDTNSSFISKCAARTLALNQSKTYFKCHRSGAQPINAAAGNSARSFASKVSCKIGATCPAGIEATEAADGISVTYWPKHVGHAQDTREPSEPDGQESLGQQTSQITQSQPPSGSSGSDASGSRMGRRGKAKSKRPRRNTSYSMLVDKAQHLLELLENGDVEPKSRTLIANMIDNVRSVVMKRYKKHPN